MDCSAAVAVAHVVASGRHACQAIGVQSDGAQGRQASPGREAAAQAAALGIQGGQLMHAPLLAPVR